LYVQTRRDASLLRDHGHSNVEAYPLCEIWVEARLVRERLRFLLADQAVMMQAVVVGSMSDPKVLKNFLKDLTDGD
jgi:hypothetical protein